MVIIWVILQICILYYYYIPRCHLYSRSYGHAFSIAFIMKYLFDILNFRIFQPFSGTIVTTTINYYYLFIQFDGINPLNKLFHGFFLII